MKCVICRNGETRSGAATVTLQRGGVTVVIKGVHAPRILHPQLQGVPRAG